MKIRKLVTTKDLDFKKQNGLLPVVVQDCRSLQVLTLAYVDREALKKTLKTKYAHYFRRSYGKVMKKGETSGNFQKVKGIYVDCDHDAVLYMVDVKGPACHLGGVTCFHMKLRTNGTERKRKHS